MTNEIKIWFTNNLAKSMEFLYVSNDIIGIIKCKLGSDGRKYIKNGIKRKKPYSKEKVEFCYNELFTYLTDMENTEKEIKESSLYLEIEISKGAAKSWFKYDEDNMEIVIEKLSGLFWEEFNDINYLDFLRPRVVKNYYA